MPSGELEESEVEIFDTDTAERRRICFESNRQAEDKSLEDYVGLTAANAECERYRKAFERIRDQAPLLTHEAIREIAIQALKRTTECPTSLTKAR